MNKAEPKGIHGIDYQLNRFGLTWEEECVRSFLALNVWTHMDRQASLSVQQAVALNGRNTARRFVTNGAGSVMIELAEYDGLPENNVPGGPADANVYARLPMCRDILEAAKWINAEETKWMAANK